MKILISGVFAFVVWSGFASWLSVEKLLPAMQKPVVEQTSPEPSITPADSSSNIAAEVLPGNLLIHFESDKAIVIHEPGIENSLADLKSWLEKHSSSAIIITGHADTTGSTGYNKSLGLKRAESIQKYCEERGIPAARISTISKGEEEPLGDNLTAEGRASSRRGEISIKQ